MRTRSLLILITLAALALPVAARADETLNRIENCKAVLQGVLDLPEKGIPPALLDNATAVAIVPDVVKLAFVVGGRHGSGVLLVREGDGGWSLPVFIQLSGGSLGWQIGAQSTDVVLVFKDRQRVDSLLKGQFTLGADASVAAGPVGRQAEAATNARMKAEIYSYARSRGIFAGVSLEGSKLAVDQDADQAFYGRPASDPHVVIDGKVSDVAPEARELVDLLTSHTRE